MLDVVILTDERYVNALNDSEYARNVMHEDQLVISGLSSKGLAVKKVAWTDPHFDWTSTKYALFRTTWDYSEKFDAFADWLMDISIKTRLINSYDLIAWNLDKHYLSDLKRDGVNTVETYFIEPKDTRTLEEIHSNLGWKETVLKPCISAGGKDTVKLSPENISEHEDMFTRLISNESMMLQPFQNSVIDRGELSLMMIGGEYTHTVLKMAQSGDFRVQDDFGGSVQDYTPAHSEIDLALQAVKSCGSVPLYARIDIINDNDGNLALTEMELVEPEMWFRRKPGTAEKLAEAVSNLF